MSVNVFLTGATGYIGGSILRLLLKDSKYKVTTIVRSEEKAKLLREKGIDVIVGSLDDHEKVFSGAVKADLVIETANSDNLNNAKSLVAGLEQRYKDTGKKPYYIHTSGSGILIDPQHPLGEVTSAVYDDSNDEQMAAIPLSFPHRNVDDYIMQHSGSYNLVIIAPTLIYGIGQGFEDISNLHTIQVPFAVRAALKAKQGFQVGNGKNIWSYVHIDDVVEFYQIILEKLLADKITTLGKNGYFLLENGEIEWSEIFNKIGEIGFQKKVFPTSEVLKAKSEEDLLRGVNNPAEAFYIGTNSRAKAEKARRLGWNPKHKDDVLDNVEVEFDYFNSQK